MTDRKQAYQPVQPVKEKQFPWRYKTKKNSINAMHAPRQIDCGLFVCFIGAKGLLKY